MNMGFYEEFNKYYDLIFPTGKPQLDFISNRIKGKKVLDIACGTGNYSIPLAKKGYHCTAIDLDEGMILSLEEKVGGENLNITAFVGDMKRLPEYFEGQTFETVFCIGNSIVHLTDPEEIQQVLKDIYLLLNEGGILILQTINYDRILKNNIDHLPTIDNKEAGVSLVRNYDYQNGLINFDTELIVKEKGKSFKNTVTLYPLRHGELTKMIETAGFSIKGLYGSFKEDTHSDDAYATIVVAEK